MRADAAHGAAGMERCERARRKIEDLLAFRFDKLPHALRFLARNARQRKQMTLDVLRRFGERRLDCTGFVFDLGRQAQQPLALRHGFAN